MADTQHPDRAAEVLPKHVILTELVRRNQQQRIVARNNAYGRVLVEGSFLSETFTSGLSVEAGLSEELADATVVATVNPCLCLNIILNGEVRFGYDSEEFVLRANPQRQSRYSTPPALAANLKRLSTFRRQIRRGEQNLSKVHIKIRSEWFQRGDGHSAALATLSTRLLDHHLAHLYWQPSPQALRACQQILALREEPDPLLRSVQTEALATRLVYEFVNYVNQLETPAAVSTKATQPPRRADSLAAAIAYLEAHLHTDIRLEKVARASAMSISALQRRFKQETGMTVFDYVRNRRLDKVRDALCKDHISISEAAYMAGYNHTSNFITAFKRKFGVTPGDFNNNNSRSL